MRSATWVAWVARLAACLALASCARYSPLPLPALAPLAESLAQLAHDGIDLGRPLSVAEVALLAVANSPDLAATRRQRGVSQAQLLQSGLLANPSITGALLPLLAGPAASNPGGSTTLGWNAGISYDVRSLLLRPGRRREARENGRSLDATLLWQEWQTVAQARLLCVDIVEGDRLLTVLNRLRNLVGGRAAASRAALDRNDVTLATAAPDLAALQTARGVAFDQERIQLGRRHQLAALLGLSPDATLDLASPPDLPDIDPGAIARTLPSLSDRRPDLAALRFGYQAEDARLRNAILSQFPNLTFGMVGSSDNSNVRSVGVQISLDLPIFDHGQGQIGIERATREQLRTEYAARLATAIGQVRAMLAEIALLQRQLSELKRDQPGVLRIAQAAEAALAAGNIDERSALDLILTRFNKEQEIIVLEQTRLEQQVAIATLSGAGLPPLSVHEDRP